MSALLQANKRDVLQDLCSSNGHFPKERLARALRYLGSNPTQQQVIFSKIERNKRLNCPPTSVEPLYVPLSYYTKNQLMTNGSVIAVILYMYLSINLDVNAGFLFFRNQAKTIAKSILNLKKNKKQAQLRLCKLGPGTVLILYMSLAPLL